MILAGLFAEEGNTHVFVAGLPDAAEFAAGVCLLSLPVLAFAALRAPWELRFFALAAGGIAVAGLAFPLVSASGHQWDIIAYTNSAERYFLMAQVAWVAILLWTASRLPRPALRAGGAAVIAVAFASGLVAAWAYPAFPNDNWPAEAHAILTARPGTRALAPHPSLPAVGGERHREVIGAGVEPDPPGAGATYPRPVRIRERRRRTCSRIPATQRARVIDAGSAR